MPSIDFIISIVMVGRRGVIKISYLGFRAIQEVPIIEVSLGLIWGTPAKWPGTCL